SPLMKFNEKKNNLLSFTEENNKTEGRESLILYPNPVENYVKINLITADRNLKMKVIGMDGQVVFESSGTHNEINESLNQRLFSFKPGVYVVNIKDVENQYSQKIIKKE